MIKNMKGGEIWGDVANSYRREGSKSYQRYYRETDADGNQVEKAIADSNDNADKFTWAPGTRIMDAQVHDVLYFAGLPLVGGSDEGGIGLSTATFGLAPTPTGFAQLFTPATKSLYADQILPFITYKLQKIESGADAGGYDLIIGNVFTGFLDATETLSGGASGLSAELKKHYGVQVIKGFIPAELNGIFAYTYFGSDQIKLDDGKGNSVAKLGLVFKNDLIAPAPSVLPQRSRRRCRSIAC